MRSVCLPSLGLALVAFLGGGAAVAGEEVTKAKKLCLNTPEINVITALDDHHAYVKLSAGRFYMFTVDKSCQEFKLARTIAISNPRRVCNDGLTLLSFETPLTGPMRCRIDTIDKVLDKDMALELIKSRAEPQ
jgi:hypothetical protein